MSAWHWPMPARISPTSNRSNILSRVEVITLHLFCARKHCSLCECYLCQCYRLTWTKSHWHSLEFHSQLNYISLHLYGLNEHYFLDLWSTNFICYAITNYANYNHNDLSIHFISVYYSRLIKMIIVSFSKEMVT